MTTIVCIPDDLANDIMRLLPKGSRRMFAATCTMYRDVYCRVYIITKKLPNICAEGAVLGSLSMLNYGIELGHPTKCRMLSDAIKSGNISCVRVLLNRTLVPCEKSIRAAARSGIVMFKLIYEQYMEYAGEMPGLFADGVKTSGMFGPAAFGGRIDILDYLVEQGHTPSSNTVLRAFKKTHVNTDVLWWGLSYINQKYISLLYWMIARGWFSHTREVFIEVVHRLTAENPSYVPGGDLYAIMVKSNDPILREWFDTHPADFDINSAKFAAVYGWTDILDICWDRGINVGDILEVAFWGNNAEIVFDWVLSKDVHIRLTIIGMAIKFECIPVMEKLYANGLIHVGLQSWVFAARHGLAYSIEFGCQKGFPFHANIAIAAASGNHVSVLEVLEKYGQLSIASVKYALKTAMRRNQKAATRWLTGALDRLRGEDSTQDSIVDFTHTSAHESVA